MPAKGQFKTVCSYGHDLTAPGARSPLRKGQRGLGDCRQCRIDRRRVEVGSSKTGPPSRVRLNDPRREAAEAAGLQWCLKCEQGKPQAEFNKDKNSPNGVSFYCRPCRKVMKAAAYERDREIILIRTQAVKFGITVEQVMEMRAKHVTGCAICNRPCPSGRGLAIDHDHATGQVRGMLCANCNRALGLLQDSPEVVASALVYLSHWKGQPHSESEASMQHASMS